MTRSTVNSGREPKSGACGKATTEIPIPVTLGHGQSRSVTLNCTDFFLFIAGLTRGFPGPAAKRL
jgi:hypothetical protein